MKAPAERWKQVGDLFEAALERTEESRGAWLDEVCSGDPGLREELERLLAAHQRTRGVLDSPPPGAGGPAIPGTSEEIVARGQIGPYELIEKIGRGGMGVIYKARDTRLGRFVALKFLPGDLPEELSREERFLAEARAASALDHPNICTIYDVGAGGDQPYIAMAFYEGETVTKKIKKGPLSVEESVDVALQTAAGLACAHERGIIHRDIKPSNLLVTPQGTVKILDFGIAKLEGRAALTRSGSMIGTVAYMSPEQARGEEVDPRADLWSLGVVLQEMLTGEPPFPGGKVVEVLHAVLHGDPRPLRSYRRDFPAALEAILRKALAKSPAERYARVEEFSGDLKALLSPTLELPLLREPGKERARPALPPQLTSFIGREREREHVRRLLSATRLLTLTGPAGTGKTRLSLQVAEEMSGDFDDGVFFVSLAEIADSDLVPPAIARSLGLEENPAHPVGEGLKAHLERKQVLLILDNFEQVAAAASLVGELLGACPGLKVLVTSRVALRLSGEHEYFVPPLDLPGPDSSWDPELLRGYSAVQLFIERARAARPDFNLTRENGIALAELCNRLDGLPLAIELAAARIKLFSPQMLLPRLGRRLDLLKGGPRDRPARHQTLRQAIAWSHDLLKEEERTLFRRLAVFRGGCTLEAAGEVAGPSVPLDPVDGIAELVDQSLLRQEEGRDGEPRFLMLETVREFALECLVRAGELEKTWHAHGEYFLALAERGAGELTGSHQVEWLDRLEGEHSNLRAALSRAEERNEIGRALRMGAALWRFWLARGYIKEGRACLERLLSHPDAAARTEVRALALQGIGTYAHNLADNEAARGYLEESVSIWRELGNCKGIADGLNNLAWVACELSDFDTCRSLSGEALARNRELGEKRGMAVALNNLGWIANYQGKYREARAHHGESLRLRRESGDRRGISFALANLAWAEQYHGDHARAEQLLEEALSILEVVNDEMLRAWALLQKSHLAQDLGALDRAVDLLEKSLLLWKKTGNKAGLATAIHSLGSTACDGGRWNEARTLLLESLAHWREIRCPWGIAAALYHLGRVEHAGGNEEKARSHYRESLLLRRRCGDERGIAECLEGAAQLRSFHQDQPERAVRLLAAAGGLRESLEAPRPPSHAPRVDGFLSRLREVLGEEMFARAWAEGRALPVGELIDHCIS